MAERDAMAEQQQVADNPGEFSIFIKNLHGKALAVTVSPDDSVWELKAKLNAQDSSLIPEMGVLIYGSRQMEDHLTLRHYKITPNCLLHYRLSLRGGGAGVKSELPVTGLALKKLVADPPKFLTAKASGSTEESYDWLNLGSPLQGNCWRCTGENLPEVTPEITQDTLKYHTTYRAHLPGAGVFQCSITGLSFEVRSAVTITYRYRTWTRHLSKAAQEMWVPAGPLFRIDVQPGIVRAVHLPHFICLAEDINTSLCSIAHFKSGKMTLERPTRVVAFSAVLENPSFSLLGVLWRRLRSTLNSFPMHSLVLIFQQLSAANTTLHLYLIPDDNSVKQSHLPFCYKSPKEQQLFVEIYIRNMAEEIGLLMTDTRNDTVVWRASLRSGDINLPACVSKTSSGAAFMKQHKTELCSRMRQLSTILLHLRDANVINSDEEEEVQGQNTSQRKNRVLLELAEKKGLEAQEQLYQILRMKDPYLITDLEKSS
ncbi:caspase recruitment domain-containing protein 8-like isoform X3 [Grus americana]|uniref:caspase recruitment domain-containing protein 8-like isoform X3 n=1 Tax=Grus americana TaxID=9117 RepID=UPI002407F057|nr:caspase recruitment domain-containing protein 8-like isoform X3 [Grus americana]